MCSSPLSWIGSATRRCLLWYKFYYRWKNIILLNCLGKNIVQYIWIMACWQSLICCHRQVFGFDARKVSARLAKRMRSAIILDPRCVRMDDDNPSKWIVKSSSIPFRAYIVRKLKDDCSGRPGSLDACEAFQRCGGCRHMFSCTCNDATTRASHCKHVLLLQIFLGNWNPHEVSKRNAGVVSTPRDTEPRSNSHVTEKLEDAFNVGL